jgi:hypothetical protein
LKLVRILFAGGLAVLAACQWIVGLERPQSTASSCGRIPPPRPPEEESVARYLGIAATSKFSFMTGEGQGYNLDGLCTCGDPGLPAEEREPACLGFKTRLNCDQDGGVDNALGLALQPFPISLGETLNVQGVVDKGLGVTVYHLSGYNGLANDSKVQLGYARALRYIGPHSGYGCDGGGPLPYDPDAGENVPPPKRDGCDSFSVGVGGDTEDLNERGSRALLEFRAVGYVSSGRVVVGSDSAITVRAGSSSITITSPTLSADIVLMDERGNDVPFGDTKAVKYRLENGLITGRVPPSALLKVIARVPLNGGARLCDDEPQRLAVYQRIRAEICDSRDVRSARPLDGKQPLGACESLSVTFGFSASPAFIGTGVGSGTESIEPIVSANCDDRFAPKDAGAPPILDASSDARSDAAVRDAAPVDASTPNYLDADFFECPKEE